VKCHVCGSAIEGAGRWGTCSPCAAAGAPPPLDEQQERAFIGFVLSNQQREFCARYHRIRTGR